MMEVNRIYQGDCLELMKQIEDNFIDLVVTSPPYDDLRAYKGYTFNFEGIARELYRIIKERGVVVWVVGDSTSNGDESGTSFKQALFFKEIGFNLHDTMIWSKTKMPQNHNRYEQGFEYMFVFSKGSPYIFNGIRDKLNTEAGATAHASYRDKDGEVKKTSSFNKTKIAEFGLRTNVWKITPCVSKENRNGHPAPFPIQLANDHILSWSNKGDIILDPFMGSGTTAVACQRTNRKFIGMELSEEYCKIARNRLSQGMLSSFTEQLTEVRHSSQG